MRLLQYETACRPSRFGALIVVTFGEVEFVNVSPATIPQTVHCSADLFGRQGWRWRVVRASNAYAFSDPLQRPAGVPASEFRNPTGTPNQEIQISRSAPAIDSTSPLEQALRRFGAVIQARLLAKGSEGTAEAT
jgi:hypothetical protein